jgi:hypothetical protein
MGHIAAGDGRFSLRRRRVAFLARFALDPTPDNAKLMRELMQKDIDRWADYVKVAKIDPQ